MSAATFSAPPQDKHTKPITRIGIAGGGQLARMMAEPARRLGLDLVVLDPDAACSASGLIDEVIVGELDDAAAITALAARSDVVTFEIERVSVEALKNLEAAGAVVRPSARTLEIIQDKLTQKRFLRDLGVPTSAFEAITDRSALASQLPFVWKARRDGYDGRGVAIVRDTADIERLPAVDALREDLIDIEFEFATQIGRDVSGNSVDYPLVDMQMDPHAHVMLRTVAPASVPEEIARQSHEIARTIADALDFVGMLALEFFVDRGGITYVNELSPRPHNSAHYTIEACETSQFEQHLRAVAGLPLGSSALRHAAVTFNVLGAPAAHGKPKYVGFGAELGDANIAVHSYDKPEVRPGRKMGHATVVAPTPEAAIALADRVEPLIRVESYDE